MKRITEFIENESRKICRRVFGRTTVKPVAYNLTELGKPTTARYLAKQAELSDTPNMNVIGQCLRLFAAVCLTRDLEAVRIWKERYRNAERQIERLVFGTIYPDLDRETERKLVNITVRLNEILAGV